MVPANYVQFTRRTDYPKLGWLIARCKAAGIDVLVEGRSFHAPISHVRGDQLEAAWSILTPVDDVPDDDPQFEE